VTVCGEISHPLAFALSLQFLETTNAAALGHINDGVVVVNLGV